MDPKKEVINSNVLVYKIGSRMINCEKKLIKNWKIFLNKILFKNVDMSNELIMKNINHYHRKF